MPARTGARLRNGHLALPDRKRWRDAGTATMRAPAAHDKATFSSNVASVIPSPWFKGKPWRVTNCGWLGSSWHSQRAPGAAEVVGRRPTPALLPAFEPGPRSGLVQRQAMAGDKLWVAGVELAKPASPRRRRRTRGRRPPVADPSHPAPLPAFEPGPFELIVIITSSTLAIL